MRSNHIAYTWKSLSYSYGYVLLTTGYSVEEIISDGRKIVLWGGSTPEIYSSSCALKSAGIEVDYFCDIEWEKDVKSEYMNSKKWWDIMENANSYIHIIDGIHMSYYRKRQEIRRLLLAGVKDLGILSSDYTRDFWGRKKFQDAVFESINEVFRENKIYDFTSLENCSSASLSRITYWDIFLKIIYSVCKSQKVKYLEVGPGIGILSLTLKKLMDIDITWLDVPVDEKDWIEISQSSFSKLVADNNIEIQRNFLEYDDTSRLNNKYDIVLMSMVMEHLLYNPVNSIIKLRNMLNENGVIMISVPSITDVCGLKIKHKNVRHYTEMPTPDMYSQEEREERWNINGGFHYKEYSYDEAMEIFDEAELECVMYEWHYPNHYFVLKRKGSSTIFDL